MLKADSQRYIKFAYLHIDQNFACPYHRITFLRQLDSNGEDAPMLTRVQRVNLSADASLALCLDTLKARNYQSTIFGARRLLCVKRSPYANCVLNVEVLIEAFSRYETKITICGNLSHPSLQWEVIGEVFSIADALGENAKAQIQQPAAFPLHAMQVCIA